MPSPPVPDELRTALSQFRSGSLAAARATLSGLLESPRPHPDVFALAGLVAGESGDFEGARHWHRRSIEVKPREPLYHCNLGRALRALSDFSGAIEAFDEALSLDRSSVDAITWKASVLELRGEHEHVLALLDRLPDELKASDFAAVVRARSLLHSGDAEQAVDVAARGAEHARTADIHRRSLHFVRGQALDRLGRIDDAFAAFSTANAILEVPFHIERERRKIEALRAQFSPATMAAIPEGSLRDETPVFVVGLPRSGSTLVEQILQSHPRVVGAGERQDLALILQVMPSVVESSSPYPYCLDRLTAASLGQLAGAYLQRVRQSLGTGNDIVVDKTLINFERVGIIRRMFPEARIIHVQRDPRAQGLSCFMQDLIPRLHPWSTRLETIAQFQSCHDSMMEHWRSLDLDVIDVRYESLVSSPESEAARLFDALGLDFSPDMLDPSLHRRDVGTASYHQVSQPIHTGAVARHERYAHHLTPWH